MSHQADHRKRLFLRCPAAERLRLLQPSLKAGSSTASHVSKAVSAYLQGFCCAVANNDYSRRQSHPADTPATVTNADQLLIPSPQFLKNTCSLIPLWLIMLCSWANNGMHHLLSKILTWGILVCISTKRLNIWTSMKHLCYAQICSNTSSQCNVLVIITVSYLTDIWSQGTHIISQSLDFNFTS